MKHQETTTDVDRGQPNSFSKSAEPLQTPRPPVKRPPRQRLLLSGVDHLPTSTILSSLCRLYEPFRSQRPTLSRAPSKTGVILTHPEAHSLIAQGIPDDIFGPSHRFTMAPMTDQQPRLFLRGIPHQVTNDDLLDAVKGACKVRRLKDIQSRAYVTFTDETTMALTLRDGVTIGRTDLIFEVPHPQCCRTCLSRDHRRCQGNPRCLRCGEEGHMAKSCKAPARCFLCGQDDSHSPLKCPEYRQWQLQRQSLEEVRLLRLIPTLQQSLEGQQDPTPALSRRQSKFLETAQKDGKKSFAEVLKSRLNRRRKNQKKQRRKKAAQEADRAAKKTPQVQPDPPRAPPNPVEAPPEQVQRPAQVISKTPRPAPTPDAQPPRQPKTQQEAIAQFSQAILKLCDIENVEMTHVRPLVKTTQKFLSDLFGHLKGECEKHKKKPIVTKKPTLSKKYHDKFAQGTWTILCRCGESFQAHEMTKHEATCSWTMDLDEVKVPSDPVPPPTETPTANSRNPKRGLDDQETPPSSPRKQTRNSSQSSKTLVQSALTFGSIDDIPDDLLDSSSENLDDPNFEPTDYDSEESTNDSLKTRDPSSQRAGSS